MEIPGRVSGGVVVLEGGASLPEGTPVIVSCSPVGAGKSTEPRRIQVPLVRTNHPGTVNLTGERAAEILDEEDASSRR
jgi:hypothetical protein